MNPSFPLQPTLSNDWVMLRPLREQDWEALFAIAADPLLWAQHPSSDRYQEPVFRNYFEGAMASKGAFLILDKSSELPVGCTRFYDFHQEDDKILIGYTFVGRSWWGMPFNRSAKALLLDYALEHVSKVHFHIGTENFRSQKAIEKIGAQRIEILDVAYHGERSNPNYVYEITRESWAANRARVYRDIGSRA